MIGHSGGDPGATTLMYFDPDTRVGFVFLTNSDPEHAAATVDLTLIDSLLSEAARLHARR